MSLTSQARADLVAALQPHVKAMAADIEARLAKPSTRAERNARTRAMALHKEERAGATFRVWLDLLSRRAAVSWVLKLVYARVLEDRGLVSRRFTGATHRELFEQLAPNLGSAAYMATTFTDLAQGSGLAELFAPQPAEVLRPSDAQCTELLTTLCATDPDTGRRPFDFGDESFDGQLMGDLYQELDPVVKERFALLQTPDFVRDFMLDRTLSAALETWPATEVRVIDPACGSGHFLIDAFRRLVSATAAAEPEWPRKQVVASALERVVGLDLNDAAANLARTRLLMTAVELIADGGRLDLAVAVELTAHVYWADGLYQHEKGVDSDGVQYSLLDPTHAPPKATLNPEQTRQQLYRVLAPRFHVVVANPPYITEKDKKAKAYHKKKVGKRPRYISASGKYSLGAPFTERTFQLAVPGGFIGLITANSFAKREFGKKTVEDVLAKKDVSLLVDTSGAYIPGHGTPTILIFARNQKPEGDTLTAVLGKRGEPSNPEDGSQGKVWTAICEGFDTPGYDSPFVSTEAVPRETFATHPWSLRGGGALGLQRDIEAISINAITTVCEHAGITSVTGEDVVYVWPEERAHLLVCEATRPLVTGEMVRDWALSSDLLCLWPVDPKLRPSKAAAIPKMLNYLERYKAVIAHRKRFGTPMIERGASWFELQELYPPKLQTPLTITFAFVATHNHFVLDRGGKVFKQSAPVIKLPADATEDDHLALLGPLNSSAACFWMKQVFFDKGRGGYGGGIASEHWEVFFEFDSTKLARFPLPPHRHATLPWAKALDALGHARADDTVATVLADAGWTDAASLRALLDARRARDLDRLQQMAAHQEELDWLVYRLYGLVSDDLPVAKPAVTTPITPGTRPFELRLAADEPDTAWFTRHGWEPHTTLPDDVDAATRDRVTQRLAAIEQCAHLRLLEQPVHKRRWYRPDYAADEQAALRSWLLDTIEAHLSSADTPLTPARIARALAGTPRVDAVMDLLDGVGDRAQYIAELMKSDAVAAHPVHRYTKAGLVKRRAWERVWALQEAEDRGESVGTIPVPPKYTGTDFHGSIAYPLRGKLDVPKERFVAHTEIPTAAGERRTGEDALYGWAGWTRQERVEKLFEFFDTLEGEGVPEDALVGLWDLMFRYLADLGRTDPTTASDLSADLRGEAGGDVTPDQLAAWLAQHPAKTSRRRSR